MRVTPQVVMESMDLGAHAGVFRNSSIAVCRGLHALLDRAVLFSFPDVTISEHASFAIDLYERGLFRLPFPVTAVAVERDLGPPLGKRGAMMLLMQEEGGGVSCVSCNEVDDGRKGAALPIAMVRRATFTLRGPTSTDILEQSTTPIVSDAVVAAMYGRGEQGHAKLRERTLYNLVGSMGLVVMLMSKGVSTTLVPPSDKLNRARAKRGKPPHRDRYIVTLDIAGARQIATAGGGVEDITGHTRGSPRMHWRRGHFRTLHRGEDGERIVPVAPALIGANESAEPIRAKAYAVRPPVVPLSGIVGQREGAA